MTKIRLAFIKQEGLSCGGTELWLQNIAARIDKQKFSVDYFYTGNTDKFRAKFLTDNGVKLIKVNCSGYDEKENGKWLDSNFYELFNENNYDLIQSAISGEKQWPFYLIKKPVIHSVHLGHYADTSANIYHTFFLSEWMRKRNAELGGIYQLSSVVPVGVSLPLSNDNLRDELHIPQNAVVAGFHQRNANDIFSPIPLNSFAKLQASDRYFIILGGGQKYSEQAKKLGIKNFIQLPHSNDRTMISKFLNTLDIFAHGRRDGETFGYVFAEAMIHNLPCLGHKSRKQNAHKDTIANGGFFAKSQNEYTQKLKLLFENQSLRQELGNKAFQSAKERFIDKDYIQDVEAVYQKIYQNSPNFQKQFKRLKFWQKVRQYLRPITKEKQGEKKVLKLFGIPFWYKKR